MLPLPAHGAGPGPALAGWLPTASGLVGLKACWKAGLPAKAAWRSSATQTRCPVPPAPVAWPALPCWLLRALLLGLLALWQAGLPALAAWLSSVLRNGRPVQPVPAPEAALVGWLPSAALLGLLAFWQAGLPMPEARPSRAMREGWPVQPLPAPRPPLAGWEPAVSLLGLLAVWPAELSAARLLGAVGQPQQPALLLTPCWMQWRLHGPAGVLPASAA